MLNESDGVDPGGDKRKEREGMEFTTEEARIRFESMAVEYLSDYSNYSRIAPQALRLMVERMDNKNAILQRAVTSAIMMSNGVKNSEFKAVCENHVIAAINIDNKCGAENEFIDRAFERRVGERSVTDGTDGTD